MAKLRQAQTLPEDVNSGTAVDGAVLKADGSGSAAFESDIVNIAFVIDGGGSVITTGEKAHLNMPFAMTITGWTVMADQVGDIVFDIFKNLFSAFPPTVANTITGSEKPSLVAQQSAQDLDLTTWTTDVAAGDVLAINVDSVATVKRVTLSLRALKL